MDTYSEDCVKKRTDTSVEKAVYGGNSSTVEGAIELDRVITDLKIVHHTDASAQEYDQIAYCGKNDWKSGESISQKEQDCFAFEGKTTYTIVKLDRDSLLFGRTSCREKLGSDDATHCLPDGSSSGARFDEINANMTFTRLQDE